MLLRRIFPAVLDDHGFHFGGSYCARRFRAARLLAKDDGIGPDGLGLGGELGQQVRSDGWEEGGGALQHREGLVRPGRRPERTSTESVGGYLTPMREV